jgi:large subunit ribosomal protein L15
MVLRIKKKRKYFGTRSWGVGNIKHARGAGSRGGVGKGGRKHKMSHLLVYERESLERKGFVSRNTKKLEIISLSQVSKRLDTLQGEKPVLELKGFKVLGGGKLLKPAVLKAQSFSASAEAKIKEAGGEAVRL